MKKFYLRIYVENIPVMWQPSGQGVRPTNRRDPYCDVVMFVELCKKRGTYIELLSCSTII